MKFELLYWQRPKCPTVFFQYDLFFLDSPKEERMESLGCGEYKFQYVKFDNIVKEEFWNFPIDHWIHHSWISIKFKRPILTWNLPICLFKHWGESCWFYYWNTSSAAYQKGLWMKCKNIDLIFFIYIGAFLSKHCWNHVESDLIKSYHIGSNGIKLLQAGSTCIETWFEKGFFTWFDKHG